MSSFPADVLVDLEGTFRRLRVGWYVFGAQAAAIHGAPRLTIDVDVTVALGRISTVALADALDVAGFALRIADDDFVKRTRVLPAVHSASGIPVDIVLAGPGIEELFLKRAEPRAIRGVKVPVACPEDVVAMKVLAGRGKDIEDVTAILRAVGKSFRRALAQETLELLERALDRRDLLPVFERALEAAAPVVSSSSPTGVKKTGRTKKAKKVRSRKTRRTAPRGVSRRRKARAP